MGSVGILPARDLQVMDRPSPGGIMAVSGPLLARLEHHLGVAVREPVIGSGASDSVVSTHAVGTAP
jgi:hypothetical protein